MTSLEELREGFLAECVEDHVGLWALLWELKHRIGTADPVALRRMTLELVRGLLESGQVRAGGPAPDGRGFRDWTPQTPDAVVSRIQREWDTLGREPNIGDIVWFTTAGTTDPAAS